jgi:hypothetical protein
VVHALIVSLEDADTKLMTKIGTFKLLSTHRLLVPKGLKVILEGPSAAPLHIEFLENTEDKEVGSVTFQGKPDHGILTLTNWNGVLGRSFKEPVHVGRVKSGERLYLFIAAQSIGGTSLLDVQFMSRLEEDSELDREKGGLDV